MTSRYARDAALRMVHRTSALLPCGCSPWDDGHQLGPGCPAYTGSGGNEELDLPVQRDEEAPHA